MVGIPGAKSVGKIQLWKWKQFREMKGEFAGLIN